MGLELALHEMEAHVLDKVIKTHEEYETALAEIESLIDLDPEPETSDADRLELLSLLIRDYEEREFPIDPPDPIEAIKFRMEQQGLKQRDLIPFIGSRSKVSEVLSRKRALSLSMLRALSAGLDIPIEILAREPEPAPADEESIDWDRFPIREMFKLGWLTADETEIEARPDEVIREFFGSQRPAAVLEALFRMTKHSMRSARKADPYALSAWTARVLQLAEPRPGLRDESKSVSPEFMRALVRLSREAEGPRLALEYLADEGIVLAIVPHLRRTYLDGCALFTEGKRTVIGMTMRYDRIDYFWFTLMHELAHAALHSSSDTSLFFDDLQLAESDDPRETESDGLAMEVLIPELFWKEVAENLEWSRETAELLAEELEIHPAIVAGRMRFEAKNYRILSQVVGHGQVRQLFPEVIWPN